MGKEFQAEGTVSAKYKQAGSSRLEGAQPPSKALTPLPLCLQIPLPSQGPLQKPSRLVFTDVANAIHA